MISGEATNGIIFGLTQPGLQHTVCPTRGGHPDHYTNDAIWIPMIAQPHEYAYDKINKCISFQKVVHIVSPCLYILVKQGINDYSDFELYDPTLRLVEVLK